MAFTQTHDETAAALPLDREALLMRCMGNLELAERVLDMYCDQFPQDLHLLLQSCETGETDGVVQASHKMKGGAASVGACELATLFTEIELSARENDLQRARQRLGEIESARDRLIEQVTSLSSST